MTLQRMDNVGIVVDDLDAAIAFFTELGTEREDKACSPSTTLTTPSPVCAATAPNSSARLCSTGTATGSATCAALRG
jgi:hypothetical protein